MTTRDFLLDGDFLGTFVNYVATKFYVVWRGRKPGIYPTWDLAKTQVDGFQGARFKSYPTHSEAQKAFADGPPPANYSPRIQPNWRDFPEIDRAALSVDAACSGNPGDMEYRGVWIDSGEEWFRFGPYPNGTNNIGEFLALVHALKLLISEHRSTLIYTDSETGMSWLRLKKAKSQLPRTPATAAVWALVDEAEAWLHQVNTSPFTIQKWKTEKWGEIPADFGRK